MINCEVLHNCDIIMTSSAKFFWILWFWRKKFDAFIQINLSAPLYSRAYDYLCTVFSTKIKIHYKNMTWHSQPGYNNQLVMLRLELCMCRVHWLHVWLHGLFLVRLTVYYRKRWWWWRMVWDTRNLLLQSMRPFGKSVIRKCFTFLLKTATLGNVWFVRWQFNIPYGVDIVGITWYRGVVVRHKRGSPKIWNMK